MLSKYCNQDWSNYRVGVKRSNIRRSKQEIETGDRNRRSKQEIETIIDQEIEIIAKFQEIEMAVGALRGLG